MKAVVWNGMEDVRVEQVPDPVLREPTDAIIRVTTTGLCGSDLHLYTVLSPFMREGDILGHEPMGIVEEVGPEVRHIAPGDRVVVPFNIACGRCFMCERDLFSQCETTQVRQHDKGAAIFGYTKLYGAVAGGQAEYLRVPQAHFGPVKLPEGPPDAHAVLLADVLPTAWQAVEYAAIPPDGSVVVFGLGPIGQMCARIAHHHGARVLAVDLVPERLAMAERHGIETIPWTKPKDVLEQIRDRTDGRGPDSAIDAVGMEAHGAPVSKAFQMAAAVLPHVLSEPLAEHASVDRLSALVAAIRAVRRGGTLSVIGVYGGMADPLPMMEIFDKQIAIRMGQANVKRWVQDILPLLTGGDPLGLDDFVTHTLPLDKAPDAYKMFQQKEDAAVKVVFTP